jgi:hypothetical protein
MSLVLFNVLFPLLKSYMSTDCNKETRSKDPNVP